MSRQRMADYAFGSNPLQPHAATTRGPRSTASDGWHGLLSIVTSEKPTARSWSHMMLRASELHRCVGHHDRAGMRGQQFRRQVGGGAGIEQHVVVDPQQRVDRQRQPRRLQQRSGRSPDVRR